MKSRATISGRKGFRATQSGGQDAVTDLASLLAKLPPLNGTASYNGDDPKYKRLSLPIEYRGPMVKQFGNVYRVFFDPGGCLRLVPSRLGERLLREIQRELEDQQRTEQLADVEANQQEVEIDRKGRLRLSCALTEPVGIQSDVVFCCRKWWIEIWAKERRQLRLISPRQAPPCQGGTYASTPAQALPNQRHCGATENAIPGS